MPSPTDIAAAARGWVGTPYRHRAAARGAGADCLGLICGLWHEFYGTVPEILPPYSPDWSEASGQEFLWDGLARHLRAKPLDDAAPGDVILMRMREAGIAKHVGVQTETGPEGRFVHAYFGHGVVESALSLPWRRRIVARFEFPDRRV
ncbi:peptidase [Actibacterium mucosum KCTC 23349]|uniref:Peptidase n=1 Tax=Actibacterium mucosum KCTC 23349 TaxID=1454373 RepID=A0A037ZP34_9RHOB|nr:NlpC/P60 family protein [Actibacterium mucosum]KAJ56586.1 peptidase [Actibacterium mucosum KCTC 23349]